MTITRIIARALLILVVAGSLSACTSSGKTRKPATESELNNASKVNVQLAIGYIQRDQYNVAKEKLEKAIEQDDENVEAYRTMAYLMGILNRPEEAEDFYKVALEISEDDPDIHNAYGTFLCQRGRYDEAQHEFKLAYENALYKTRFLAYSNAGTCLIEMNRFKEAEVMLRRALQAQPKLQGALLSMAEVGLETGKFLMSRAYIQRYHADYQPTAESLWLQMQAEKALDSREHYLQAARKLLDLFPDSVQAADVEESVRYERKR